MEFSDSIIIERPLADVWRYLTDIDHYPAWYPGLSALSGRFAEGERLRMDLNVNGRRLQPTVRIISLRPGTELAWQGSLFRSPVLQRLFSITRSFQLHAVDAQHTRFSNREIFSGLIGVTVGFLMQARLKPRYRQLNQALKDCCERGDAHGH